MYRKIKQELISQEEIQEKIAQVGTTLTQQYQGKPLLLLCILKGSFIFMADLCRAIKTPCEIAFMAAKSYSATESTGKVEITLDIAHDLSKYHVLIVEDIIDTGITLAAITDILKQRNPLSLKIVTLLDKPSKRKNSLKADISLFTVPDLFVIGYGLDCSEHYRELPYIGVYDDE